MKGILPTVSTSTSVPEPLDSIEIQIINEYRDEFIRTFVDETERVNGSDGWKNKYTLETHVREYLEKLLTQMKIAIQILKSSTPVTHKQCVKLISLWNCSKRQDVQNYFKKLAARQALSTGQNTTTTPNLKIDTSPSAPTFPDTSSDSNSDVTPLSGQVSFAFSQFDDSADVLDIYNKALSSTSFKVNKVTILHKDQKSASDEMKVDKETKYDVPVEYKGSAKNNFSKMRDTAQVPIPGIALFSLEVAEMAKGFLDSAIISILAAGMTIKNVSLIFNSFAAARYQDNLESFRQEMPYHTKEEQVYFGCSQQEAMQISVMNFNRDMTKDHTIGMGVHFYPNPVRAIHQAKKESKGESLSLIVSTLLVGDAYDVKPGHQEHRPVAKSDISSSSSFSSSSSSSCSFTLFYENHVLKNSNKEIEIITANKDGQALALFHIEGEATPTAPAPKCSA